MSVSSRSKRPLLARQHVERLGAVDRGHDLVACIGERARGQRAQRFFVFGDQNARHARTTFSDHADERQLAERVRDVHAVADDEQIGAHEADEIRVERDRALAGLLQQHAGEHAPRAARREQVLGVGERAAGFEDVVDQHARRGRARRSRRRAGSSRCRTRPCRRGSSTARRTRPRASSPTACSARIRSAAKMKLPLSTATTSRFSSAAALISCASASLRAAIVGGVEQDADPLVGDLQGARSRRTGATSRRLKKRTITSRPSGGGEASRARNGSPLPEPSVRLRRQRRPGVDLVAGARCATPRRSRGTSSVRGRQVHDHSLDHQHRHAVLEFVACSSRPRRTGRAD